MEIPATESSPRHPTAPFFRKFPATFARVFLCIWWRPVASPRVRCWFRARSGDRPAKNNAVWLQVAWSRRDSQQVRPGIPSLHYSPAALANAPQSFAVFPFVISVRQVIANSRIGRVLLHTLCAIRDRHWKWHWRGMVREFTEHFLQPRAGFPFVPCRG
jgi:hypothetical protein